MENSTFQFLYLTRFYFGWPGFLISFRYTNMCQNRNSKVRTTNLHLGPRWWFQRFFMCTSTWGKWSNLTNMILSHYIFHPAICKCESHMTCIVQKQKQESKTAIFCPMTFMGLKWWESNSHCQAWQNPLGSNHWIPFPVGSMGLVYLPTWNTMKNRPFM